MASPQTSCSPGVGWWRGSLTAAGRSRGLQPGGECPHHRRYHPLRRRRAFRARKKLRTHFVFGLTNQLSPRTVIPIRPLGYELLEVGVFGEDLPRQLSQREPPLIARNSL